MELGAWIESINQSGFWPEPVPTDLSTKKLYSYVTKAKGFSNFGLAIHLDIYDGFDTYMVHFREIIECAGLSEPITRLSPLITEDEIIISFRWNGSRHQWSVERDNDDAMNDFFQQAVGFAQANSERVFVLVKAIDFICYECLVVPKSCSTNLPNGMKLLSETGIGGE